MAKRKTTKANKENPQPEGAAPTEEVTVAATERMVVQEGQEAPAETAEPALFDADVSTTDPEAETIGGEGAELASDELPVEPIPELSGERLESIIESLLFASDRPLMVGDLRRALGVKDRDVKDAMARLSERRAGTGLQVSQVAGGFRLQTHPDNQHWVQKFVTGRPVRLSRAMLETLSIIAYRQPVTRPEIDDIRGVDCGPVLKTLLDRQLIRVIGKREEVGRPLLYGTTPDFLKTFNIAELNDLPTLRDFHELGEEDRALVDSTHGASTAGPFAGGAPEGAPEAERPAVFSPAPDDDDQDDLLDDLDNASAAAARALRQAGKDVEPEGLQAGAADTPERA